MNSSELDWEAWLVHFKGIKGESELIYNKVCWSLWVVWWFW